MAGFVRELAQLLASIPGTIYGVIIGGGLTLLGVRAQLRHDARQRERDRQMNLRKDVYLEAAEAQAAYHNYLVGLGRLDMSFDTLAEPLKARQGWLNKLHAVASLETLRAMTDLGDYFVEATFDLTAQRLRFEELNRELARVEAIMTQLVELGRQATQNQPPAGFGSAAQNVQADLQRLRAEWETHKKRQVEIIAELSGLNREILRRGIHHSLQYPALLARANVALRNEMELPIDAAAYLALVERTVSKARASSERLLAQLDEMADRP